ncbi:MAG: DUF3862 domain-containing protein [Oscillospiraceae bacterium]|jgi:hypothetical protein|nr:DUF3862 domain-containing protein [Oscillospiraceae bacterium]
MENQPNTKRRTAWYKKRWVWAIAVVWIVGGIIYAITQDDAELNGADDVTPSLAVQADLSPSIPTLESINILVEYTANTAMNIYDMTVYLDDEMLGYLEQGHIKAYQQPITSGTLTFRIVQSDKPDNVAEKEFEVTEDGYYYFICKAQFGGLSIDYRGVIDEEVGNKKLSSKDEPVPDETPAVEPTSDKITLEKFNALESGMSYNQVVEIIGETGTLLSETTLFGTTSKMYSWDGKGIFGGTATVMFENDRLFSKSQIGLN